jgi:hypothetical protein
LELGNQIGGLIDEKVKKKKREKKTKCKLTQCFWKDIMKPNCIIVIVIIIITSSSNIIFSSIIVIVLVTNKIRFLWCGDTYTKHLLHT